ncbi:hypothetical protein TSUD_369870 [Trifolium subterraneum]|uniref:Uncharacterized protein n=1 Tax=Trifolium subterraneum TaxID=3900 RepID=A0A2Z6NXG1_TRISU|nr:hypothetical protein TSUD_369870 [Trifolium subterraneum]
MEDSSGFSQDGDSGDGGDRRVWELSEESSGEVEKGDKGDVRKRRPSEERLREGDEGYVRKLPWWLRSGE